MNKKNINELSYNVVGAAIKVHKAVGPGLLESVYQLCMKKELQIRGIAFKPEFDVPLIYEGQKLETVFRCDFYIENSIVLELKTVEKVTPIHEAQLLTYMRLLEAPKGLIINFNCMNIFKDGQKSFVNELFRALPDQ